MAGSNKLARLEQDAEHGIIEFAENLKTIRDEFLYPGAEGDSLTVRTAWKSYCKDRWGMSQRSIEQTMQAMSVLGRLQRSAASLQIPGGVSSAAAVASLPEPVQDAILGSSEDRADVRLKAKTARKEAKRIVEQEGREAEPEELVEAAAKAKPPKKPKRKMKASKFVSNLSQALWHLKEAANLVQTESIDDVENDYGWVALSKIEYEVERARDKLYQPEVIKDIDESFAELLEGEDER